MPMTPSTTAAATIMKNEFCATAASAALRPAPMSKIFPNEAFGYWKITVERPLRLKGIDPKRVYSAKEIKDLKEKLPKADDAPAVIRKKTKTLIEYEPDPDLRDTEQIPLLEEGGIEAFFKREVMPHAPDAWIEPDKTQIGYEISFTRHFYKPQPLRTLGEIKADLEDLQSEAEGLLGQIVSSGGSTG